MIMTIFTIFGVILLALLHAFQVQSTKVLNVGGLAIFTDQTMPYGSQNRGYSPLERQASMLWGAHQFNNRDGSMVKEIASADYMDGCDIQLNFSFFDIGKTQEGAIQAYREATILNPSHPAKVLVADIWSSRTKTLSYIGKVDKIIINSGSATSDELDLVNDYPYFTRTIPPDSAVSEAAVKFLQNQGFDKIGCVYVNDPYGVAFKNGVVLAAAKFGIDAYSSPVLSDYSTNPIEAILDESNGLVNAWIGVIFTSDLEPVMRDAVLAGAAGGDNVWVYTDGMNEYDFVQWSAGGGNYDKCQDGGNNDCNDISDSLSGAFRIVATGGALTANGDTLFDQFDATWHTLDSDSDFQKLLAEKSLKKDVTGNFFVSDGNPSYTIDGFGVVIPNGTDMSVYNETFFQHSDLSQYESFFFDSAVQVGLGACKALSDNGDDFSVDASSVEEMEVFADKLIAGMTSITYEGWSGQVIFDEVTGSRTPSSTLFDIGQIIYNPSDDSLALSKVCDWSSAREVPFNFECATCVTLRYLSGLSTAPPQRKANIVDTVGEEGGVKIEILVGSLAGILTFFGAWYYFVDKEKREYKRKISVLQTELSILKEYDDKEKEMIDNEITGFRKNFEVHRDKNKAANTERGELDKFLIPANDVKPIKMIGKGSFGEVFEAEYRGQKVAVKTMTSVDAENLERFRDEIILMSDLHHANVVFMVGACWEKQLMALVLEFCQNGTASDNLTTDCDWGDPLFKWAKDIALGIGYLHQISFFDTKNNVQVSNIIHRDIKPDNCLVTETFGIKVSDFGEARMADINKTMTMVGTPFYVAPEVIRGDHYSISADVYSYAMTLVCFATKDPSLSKWLKKAYRDELIEKIGMKIAKEGNGDGAPTLSDNRVAHWMCNRQWRPTDGLTEDLKIPKSVASLIEICWLDDPNERPDFNEIKEYLLTMCMEEIFGVIEDKKTGESFKRRTSTSGMRVQSRIMENHIRKEVAKDKKKKKKEEGDDSADIFKRKEWMVIKQIVSKEGEEMITFLNKKIDELMAERKKVQESGIN